VINSNEIRRVSVSSLALVKVFAQEVTECSLSSLLVLLSDDEEHNGGGGHLVFTTIGSDLDVSEDDEDDDDDDESRSDVILASCDNKLRLPNRDSAIVSIRSHFSHKTQSSQG